MLMSVVNLAHNHEASTAFGFANKSVYNTFLKTVRTQYSI